MTFRAAAGHLLARNDGRSRIGPPHASRPILSLAMSFALLLQLAAPSFASRNDNSDNPAPRGTLLIPITPKIDNSTPTDTPPLKPKAKSSSRSSALKAETPSSDTGTAASGTATAPAIGKESAEVSASSQSDEVPADDPNAGIDTGITGPDQEMKPPAEKITAETGTLDTPGEDSEELLKGTIQMVADDTEYDQNNNTFLGTGNAVVIMAGQNSKLEADTVLYDQNNQMIDARGNVRIYRNGQLTTGSSFKFKVTSDEYLITAPDTEINGTTVVARTATGTRDGLAFQKGVMQMANPIRVASNAMYGPISNSQDYYEKFRHPDAFIPTKPSYKFKARKMVYERYKDSGNLTVFGGRVEVGKFSFPVGKFVMTAGQENSRVTFPVTPLITNNLQMGGTSIGPSFNFAEGKRGVFSVAPLLMMGGTAATGTAPTHGLGLGVRIGYRDNRLSTHLAYGTNSNMVVGDIKYQFNRTLKLQSGINRYLEDGIFGQNRARLRAEVVHYKYLNGLIPGISNITFRSAFGAMQDNTALINQSPQYAKLFTVAPNQVNKLIGAARVSEQMTAQTQPIFSLGDDKYGSMFTMFGGVAGKGYSTGNALGIAELGPILRLNLNKVHLVANYTQAAIAGKSPFVFDEYLQGSRSVSLSGDVKLAKWLTVGGIFGYNLDNKLPYQKTITAAIGRDDFKLLLSHDMITGLSRYGFDLLYGQPIPYDKLVLKGTADQGQLGGI